MKYTDRVVLFQHQITKRYGKSGPLDEVAGPGGVYVYGGVGTGKSLLVDMFFASVDGDCIPKRRLHFHEFMLEVHAKLHYVRSQSDYDGQPLEAVAAMIAENVRLLCLDEFQVVDVADAMILKTLFEVLMRDHGVIVTMTSNRPPELLYLHGLNRSAFLPFIDFLRDTVEVLNLEGIDHRKVTQQRPDKVYYDSLNSTEPSGDLHKRFSQMCDNSVAIKVDETIAVRNGRDCHVPRGSYQHGAALFEFRELCGWGKGVADYLAILRIFPTVFVNGVPEFSYLNRDEAR
ncbi:hypothetical protein SARC_13354, partial [Sphaeroforma arctica JP610]